MRLAVCNSALHGIPDAGGALKEVARVLVPSGRLVMTVATPSYASGLPQVRLLARLGLKGTARRYARRVNARNGHERRAWLEEWQGELAAAGLAVEGHAYYFGGRAAAVWGVLAMLPFRALALLRYAPGPVRRAAARTTEALVELSAGRPHPVGERAGYLLIVARKPEGRG